MKHPSSREFFAYWDARRGDARAPDRSEIEPDAVRGLLGDIFVLSYDNEAGYPFRVAGTRVCALLGRDLKDFSFSAMTGFTGKTVLTGGNTGRAGSSACGPVSTNSPCNTSSRRPISQRTAQ